MLHRERHGRGAGGDPDHDVIHPLHLLRAPEPHPAVFASIATAAPLLWLLERRRWMIPLDDSTLAKVERGRPAAVGSPSSGHVLALCWLQAS